MLACGLVGLRTLARAARATDLSSEAVFGKVVLFVAAGWLIFFVGPFVVAIGDEANLFAMFMFYALFDVFLVVGAGIVLRLSEEKKSVFLRSLSIASLLLVGILPLSLLSLGELFMTLFHIRQTY